MVWVVRILKISQVARDTCRVRQIVVSIRVALAALQRSVRTGQGPTRGCMIKCCRRPRRCVVANLALLGEARRDVIRVVGSLKILQMATHASSVRDVVVAIYVALSALHAGVCARQGETSFRMIEGRWRPRRCAVTDLAGLRNPSRHVIGISCPLKVFYVA
jgi:hypothetical protein